MFKKKKKNDIPENIEDLVEDFKKLKEENKEIKKEIKEIKEREKFFLQNVKMIRFNPFYEEGGNQSFTMSLLDKEGSGVVVTSLYTKEGGRIYGKPIVKGKSDYSLSKEEKEAIQSSQKEEK